MRKLANFQSRFFRWIISDRDYVFALQRPSFLSFFYQKILRDMVLLEKMIINQAQLKSEIQNSFFNTKPSTLGLFSVPKTQKFCCEDNFFVMASRCANELLELNVNKFDMPLGIFCTKEHTFLVENLLIFTLISLVLIL